MKVYWEENNVCDYDYIGCDKDHIMFEDYARNNLRINKNTLEVDIEINNEWKPMNKKVYKYE